MKRLTVILLVRLTLVALWLGAALFWQFADWRSRLQTRLHNLTADLE
jgi:hypothetical protein